MGRKMGHKMSREMSHKMGRPHELVREVQSKHAKHTRAINDAGSVVKPVGIPAGRRPRRFLV